MTPFYEGGGTTIFAGHVLNVLRELPAASVHCCITSPPYWGLRDYQTAKWEGGKADCDHKRESQKAKPHTDGKGYVNSSNTNWDHRNEPAYRAVCGKCGANRVDAQIGLEETPEEYTAKIVEVFREVRRVLRPDGVLWLNMGDSYTSGGRSTHGTFTDDSIQATAPAIKSTPRAPQTERSQAKGHGRDTLAGRVRPAGGWLDAAIRAAVGQTIGDAGKCDRSAGDRA